MKPFILAGLMALMPYCADAQPFQPPPDLTPAKCSGVITFIDNGDGLPVVDYATNLFEKWNDESMAAGGKIVDIPNNGLGGAVPFWYNWCKLEPDRPFEDAVRFTYMMDKSL